MGLWASQKLSSSNLPSPSRADSILWPIQNLNAPGLTQLSIASFNLLAPCYKRLSQEYSGKTPRESSQQIIWEERAKKTLEFFELFLFPDIQIIGVQEFWVAPSYQSIFRNYCDSYGYTLHCLQRTGIKADAVAFMVHESLEVMAHQDVHLCSISDRVALLLWVRDRKSAIDLVVANTHLSFPHSDFDRFNQLRQIYYLTDAIDTFAKSHGIEGVDKIVLGDFNVVDKSGVCDHLRLCGYLSSLQLRPPEASSGCALDMSRLVTHRNHRKEEVGVDHIFIKRGSSSSGNGESVDTTISGTDEKPKMNAYLSSTAVLPEYLDASAWAEDFTISDHRPVCANFVIARSPPLVEDGVGGGPSPQRDP